MGLALPFSYGRPPMPASDQVITPDRYSIIPRTLIFLTRGDTVLLLRGSPTKKRWPSRYNGLGGHIEAGEDPLTSARRELMEEAGLESPDLRLVGVMLVDTGSAPGVGVFIFRGQCSSGQPRPSPEGTPEWHSLSDLPGLPLVDDLPQLLPPLLALRPGDPPLLARLAYDASGQPVLSFPSPPSRLP